MIAYIIKGDWRLLKKSLLFSFSFIGQIGFSTALPLVVFGILGRYLDKKYETSPYLLLLGILIATAIVFFIARKIVRNAIGEIHKINE